MAAKLERPVPGTRVLVVDDEKNIRATLPKLLAARPELAVAVVTAYATIETAVEAMRRGARDYLPKPFTPAQIRHVVDPISEHRALLGRIAELEARLAESTPDTELASESPIMRAVLEMIARVAAADVAVLLRGESGTGKTVLARALHRQSARRGAPFAVVNCPTLTEELLASELFGHARGAFTGAVRDQPRRVEAAEGGTLFLDEIGELSPALQAKLLRFLQDKQFERVGETRTRSADVCVVAATNRDLEADVASGRFFACDAVRSGSAAGSTIWPGQRIATQSSERTLANLQNVGASSDPALDEPCRALGRAQVGRRGP
ncbi:MAG: sigma 54-interacting transcriptional regulator [Myxococcota bacterium]